MKPMRILFALLAVAVFAQEKTLTPGQKTAGMRAMPGYIPMYYEEKAGKLTLGLVLHPQRAARLLQYNARDQATPALAEIIDSVIAAAWKTPKAKGLAAEVQYAVQAVALYHLKALASVESAPRGAGTRAIEARHPRTGTGAGRSGPEISIRTDRPVPERAEGSYRAAPPRTATRSAYLIEGRGLRFEATHPMISTRDVRVFTVVNRQTLPGPVSFSSPGRGDLDGTQVTARSLASASCARR